MKQIEIFTIDSPCIGVCQSGAKGLCLGCYRSREERLHWVNLEDDVKSKIIKACAVRKKRAEMAQRTKKADGPGPQQINFLDDI